MFLFHLMMKTTPDKVYLVQSITGTHGTITHVKLLLEDSSSVAGLRGQFFLILTVILGSGMPLGILF